MYSSYENSKLKPLYGILLIVVAIVALIWQFTHFSGKHAPTKSYIQTHKEIYEKKFDMSSKYDVYVNKNTGQRYYVYKWPSKKVLERVG